ncbi:MAG TPA: type II toxin-antitoxin system VapC family toxin [Pirellulales bacterium]|nr:type II toxin-antitoxin system VapC family toxin [Pirellulales bacterium]
MTIVVDASVAVKWFVPEPGDEAAEQLLESGEPLIAPALIRIEVAGAFLRRLKKGELPEDDTRVAYQAWERTLATGAVRLVPDVELYDDAVHCAFMIRHDLPDCLYLALGKRLGASIITADPPFQKRAKQFYERISLLEGRNAN